MGGWLEEVGRWVERSWRGNSGEGPSSPFHTDTHTHRAGNCAYMVFLTHPASTSLSDERRIKKHVLYPLFSVFSFSFSLATLLTRSQFFSGGLFHPYFPPLASSSCPSFCRHTDSRTVDKDTRDHSDVLPCPQRPVGGFEPRRHLDAIFSVT